MYHQTSTLNPKPYTARAEDTPPPSMSVTSVEEGKRRVLQAVAKAGTQDVLKAARDLELLAPADDTARRLVGGQWALVFSTQTDNTLGA